VDAAGRAIAREFWERHRWGFGALSGYFAVLGIIKLFLLGSGQAIEFDDGETFALAVMMPLAAGFTYFLAVFTYGLAGDLAARESMYPARKFTLPVTNAALAGWPMLIGIAAVTGLWIALRLVGLWPTGVHVPYIWPAIMAAALLAWTQALTWLPYPLRGLRVIITVLWLATIDIVALIAIELNAREPLMIAILAPHIPLAYLAARSAIARARRGDIPDWSGGLSRITPAGHGGARRDAHGRSPARAQVWFETRQHGRSLPVLVALLLPFQLALLALLRGSPILVVYILSGVLLTPPVMAAFAAGTLRTSNRFTLTRPMTNAGLIAAKLKMTLRSTLVAWLLVLVAIPAALALTGTTQVVTDIARTVDLMVGTPRAITAGLLVLLLLMASTWKLLVQSLYVGLAGREWLTKASVFVMLVFFTGIGPVINWIMGNAKLLGDLWDALPTIVAVLVALKMAAAAWVVVRLHERRQLTDRALLAGAALWAGAVFVLYGVLVWWLATPLIPRHVVALFAILFVPLTRLSATPLALAWNRHR
jgi:hypothetical protein